jgi:hypothetical protein
MDQMDQSGAVKYFQTRTEQFAGNQGQKHDPAEFSGIKRSRAPTQKTGTMQLGSPLGRMRRQSNPSDWERIDLGQLVPSERAIARKGKGPQVTDQITKPWIAAR